MVIAQMFIDVSCCNFTRSDSIDYGGRTSYTVSSCKESFYVGYCTGGLCNDASSYDRDTIFLESLRLDALPDGRNDDMTRDTFFRCACRRRSWTT